MKNLKKCTLFLLIFVFIFAISGCDMLKSSISKQKANNYVEDFIDSTDINLLESIKTYSSEKIETTDLIKLQRELYVNFSKCEFVINEINLDDAENFDKATCKLTIKYRDITDVLEEHSYATADDYHELIRDVDVKSSEVKLKLVQKNGQWKFDDLNELYDMLYKPYTELVFIDRIGIAINPDAKYYKDRCISSLWYDPLMSVPLEGNSISEPMALQCAFYFERPVTEDFEARLLNANGNVLARRPIKMDTSVIAICDFSSEYIGIDEIKKGKYFIELYYNDELIGKTSNPISVK